MEVNLLGIRIGRGAGALKGTLSSKVLNRKSGHEEVWVFVYGLTGPLEDVRVVPPTSKIAWHALFFSVILIFVPS